MPNHSVHQRFRLRDGVWKMLNSSRRADKSSWQPSAADIRFRVRFMNRLHFLSMHGCPSSTTSICLSIRTLCKWVSGQSYRTRRLYGLAVKAVLGTFSVSTYSRTNFENQIGNQDKPVPVLLDLTGSGKLLTTSNSRRCLGYPTLYHVGICPPYYPKARCRSKTGMELRLCTYGQRCQWVNSTPVVLYD